MKSTSAAGLSTERPLRQRLGAISLVAGMGCAGLCGLQAGGVLAAAVAFPPLPAFNTPATENGATILGLAGPIPESSSGVVEFTSLGPSALNGRPTWQIKTDFSPNLQGAYLGIFAYSLTAPAGERWVSASLSQTTIPQNPADVLFATKDIYGDRGPGGPVDLLLSFGGIFNTASTPIIDFVNPDDDGVIFVIDTYLGLGFSDAKLDAIVNSVQTPAPLPVLGASAAFGLSRKLRSRIQAARQS